jgi:hypothetical protein
MSATDLTASSLPGDDQATIDGVLQLVYSQTHRQAGWLAKQRFETLGLDDLRAGPLGHDLRRLALFARGDIHETPDTVQTMVQSILQTLFWSAAADDYVVPRSFWDTETGRFLMRAKSQSYTLNELISVGDAATALGVSRVTIFRWLDDRTLGFVVNSAGHTLVVRRDVENLTQIVEPLGGN